MIARWYHPVECIKPWDIALSNEIRLVLVEIEVYIHVSVELYTFYLEVHLSPPLTDPAVVLVLVALELIHDHILIIAFYMANNIFLEVLLPDRARVLRKSFMDYRPGTFHSTE